jgi:hypothetical protein
MGSQSVDEPAEKSSRLPLWGVVAGLGYDDGQIKAKTVGHPQCRFKGRTAQAPLDITDHLLGEAAAPFHGVFRQTLPFALGTEQADNALAKFGIGFMSVHPEKICQKRVDIIRHNCYVFPMIFIKRIGPDPHANGAKSVGCHNCPDIWEIEGGDFAVIGIDITNLAGALPPSAGCGPDERIVRVPRNILVNAKADIPDRP